MNMIHKNNSQIQWGTNVRSYMFGSQIEHHPLPRRLALGDGGHSRGVSL